MKRFTKLSSLLLLLLVTTWTEMFGKVYPCLKDETLKASEITKGKQIALWPVNTSNSGWFTSTGQYSPTLSPNNVFIVEETEGTGTFKLKRKSDGLYMSNNNGAINFTDNGENAVVFTANKPGTSEGEDGISFPYTGDDGLENPPAWDNEEGSKYNYLVRFTISGTKTVLNVNTGFTDSKLGTWTGVYVKEVHDIPFIYSEAPKDGQFSKNTHWYYLKLNNKYATYNEGNDYISLSKNNPINYGSFWAFVKNEDGSLKIYNAATGTSKVLAATAPNTAEGDQGKNTRPYMQEETTLPAGTIGAWDLEVATPTSSFYLDRAGEENYKLNDFAGGGIMTFWTAGKGTGSEFTVESVSIPDLINTTRESQSAIAGAVGTLKSEDYQLFIDALNKNTAEGLSEALRIQAEKEKIAFNPNKSYYLFAYGSASVTKYMHINDDATLNSADKQTDNASILWQFSGDESNGYKISTQGKYLSKVTTDSENITTTDESEAASYNLMKVANKAAAFYIRPTDGKGLHIDANGHIVGWNEGGGSEWYLIEAPSIDIAISSAGYATVNYPFAVQLPEGLTAYTGTANPEKSKFMLKEVPNGAVPANTPVVVEGTEGTYPLTIDYENTAERIDSDLSGNLLPIEITPNDYILAKDANDIVGFYKTSDGGTLAQNKAYIKSTSAIQGVRGFGFSTEGDGTTGIESTVTETENEEYYDLQGRRIMNPTKGIYVTKSGKKVLFIK